MAKEGLVCSLCQFETVFGMGASLSRRQITIHSHYLQLSVAERLSCCTLVYCFSVTLASMLSKISSSSVFSSNIVSMLDFGPENTL